MSNLHSNQTGKQVHYPKYYERSGSMGIPLKIDNTTIGYVQPPNSYSTAITCNADVGANLQNKYFCVYSEHNAKKIALYFDVDGSGSFTIPTDYEAMQSIPIASDATAVQVATAIDTALKNLEGSAGNNHIYRSINRATNVVTLVQQGVFNGISDVDTGFSFVTTATLVSADGILYYDHSHGGFVCEDMNETIQDIVGGMVTGNTETNITVTYDDATGKLNFDVTLDGAPLTTEAVQDIVGDMVSGNTETGVVVTYDDTAGKLNFVSPVIVSASWNGRIDLREGEVGRSTAGLMFGPADTRNDGKYFMTTIATPTPTMSVPKATAILGSYYQGGAMQQVSVVRGSFAGTGSFALHIYKASMTNTGHSATMTRITTMVISCEGENTSACFQSPPILEVGALEVCDYLVAVVEHTVGATVQGSMVVTTGIIS